MQNRAKILSFRSGLNKLNLDHYSHFAEVWIEASDFELKENGSPDSARDLCMKALRWHPDNKELWLHVNLRE